MDVPLHGLYMVRCGRSRCKYVDPFICRQTTTTGKIANNGLVLHHRNVGYVAKRAKICILERRRCGWIERRDAFLWVTRHFNGASKRTKFGVILGRRHNEYAISSITGLPRCSSFFSLFFSHSSFRENSRENSRDQKDWLNRRIKWNQCYKVFLTKFVKLKMQKG